MNKYLLRRIYQTVLVLLTVVTIVFVLFRLLPGDPTDMMVDQSFDEVTRQRLLAEWGLDAPLLRTVYRFPQKPPPFKLRGVILLSSACGQGNLLVPVEQHRAYGYGNGNVPEHGVCAREYILGGDGGPGVRGWRSSWPCFFEQLPSSGRGSLFL